MAVDPIVAVLIERRKALQLSQQALAERIGVKQSGISAHECGRGGMTLATLRKLCVALGVELFAVAPPTDALGAGWTE